MILNKEVRKISRLDDTWIVKNNNSNEDNNNRSDNFNNDNKEIKQVQIMSKLLTTF